MSAPGEPPDKKKLALATIIALAVAALVLVTAVLPAEYGIDPTGVGGALGLTALRAEPGDNATTTDPSGRAPVAQTQTVTLRAYAASYAIVPRTVLTKEGYLSSGDGVLLLFTLSDANMTRITARLDFIDANTTPSGAKTRPDTFEIQLKAPNGDVSDAVLVRSDPTSGGGIGKVSYTIQPTPYPREIDAVSEAEARTAFASAIASSDAQKGEWRARVTMVEAGGADAQGVPLPGAGGTPTSDDGNTWKLTLTLETYELQVAEKPGTEQRIDTTTILLPPGGEAEYKLLVSYGKRVDYSWNTSGLGVYYDFHGDRIGDKSGGFTRHKNGNAIADAGTFLSPFDGRHGWFWRNTSPQEVTITLDTRGQYDVIGRTL